MITDPLFAAIEARRLERKLTVTQLCGLAGVSHSRYYAAMADAGLTVRTLRKLARVVDLELRMAPSGGGA